MDLISVYYMSRYSNIGVTFSRSRVSALWTGFLGWTELTIHQRRCSRVSVGRCHIISLCFIAFILLCWSLFLERSVTSFSMSIRHGMNTVLVLFVTGIGSFERVCGFLKKVVVWTWLMSGSLIDCWRKMIDIWLIRLGSSKDTSLGDDTEILIKELIDYVPKFSQRRSIQLNWFDISLTVSFSQGIDTQNIILFPIEKKDFFIFDKNPLINFKFFLLRLEKTTESSSSSPPDQSFCQNVR